MAVSRRMRFEVLRRDNHTCQYCGGVAPDVPLHIDHVIPVALGGSDEPGNLVAACKDCNNGKSSVPADAPFVEKITAHAAAYALELTDAMTKIRANLAEQKSFIDKFDGMWNKYKLVATNEPLPLPIDYRATLRKWHQMGVPLELIEMAIEIAAGNEKLSGAKSYFSYTCGVVYRQLKTNSVSYTLTEPEVAVYTQAEHEESSFYESYKAYEAGYKQAEAGADMMTLDEAIERWETS